MRDFKKLEVWKEGISLVRTVYGLTNEFPQVEQFGLANQMQRAVVSVPSNIAEGCSRESNRDFSRFLQISLGSLFELETQLIVAKELGYIAYAQFDEIQSKVVLLQKRVNRLIQTTGG